MHAISSYRGNRPTHTNTHPPTNRQGQLQYTVPQLAHSDDSVMKKVLGGDANIACWL